MNENKKKGLHYKPELKVGQIIAVKVGGYSRMTTSVPTRPSFFEVVDCELDNSGEWVYNLHMLGGGDAPILLKQVNAKILDNSVLCYDFSWVELLD